MRRNCRPGSLSWLSAMVALLVSASGLSPVANAQDTGGTGADEELPSIDLGERIRGQTYPIRLTAVNEDCEGEHSFRFMVDDIPWLTATGDATVKGLEPGESGSIAARLEFSKAALGRQRALLQIKCETCGFWIFKTCRASEQAIVLTATVIDRPEAVGTSKAEGTTIDADLRPAKAEEAEDWRVDLRAQSRLQIVPVMAALIRARPDAPWAGNFSHGRDCPAIRAAIAALEAEIAANTCDEERRVLDRALADLERAKEEVAAERARRTRLRTAACVAGGEYRDTLAALDAARAGLMRAQAAFDETKALLADALADHFDWPAGQSPFTGAIPPGAEGQYEAIPLGGGLQIAFRNEGDLIGDHRRPLLIDRLRRALGAEIAGGVDMIAAARRAKAAFGAAAQALAEAEAAERAAAESIRRPIPEFTACHRLRSP